jgi:hypothetical protein
MFKYLAYLKSFKIYLFGTMEFITEFLRISMNRKLFEKSFQNPPKS